ncbi:MAG: hypothetical protein KDA77_15370 [Planctomycetaceae bacterium]|nr:hypothetical protein [Planctomycetaceae bacterium]
MAEESAADLCDVGDAQPWHFVVRPTTETQLTDFFRLLTVTHTMRWHAHYATGGTGHLYQGRFKSFPIQSDDHLLTVMRYVERNPLRANLVQQAEEWEYGSAWARQQKQAKPEWLATPENPRLPRNWRALVNKPQTDAELTALRKCIVRGRPRLIKESRPLFCLPAADPASRSPDLFSVR